MRVESRCSTSSSQTARGLFGANSKFFPYSQVVAAKPLLLDVAKQCGRSKASRRMHWQSVLKALAQLYDAWHADEPDKGFDQEAAEWRAKLPPT